MPEPYIDRGEPLPRSYGENRIVAMVRSPEQIFVYWDVESEVRIAGSGLLIRVRCISDGTHFDMVPSAEADNWYLNVSPNRTYRFELYERRADGLRLLAESARVTTPVRWPGESGPERPAEVVHAEQEPLARSVAPDGEEVTFHVTPSVPAHTPPPAGDVTRSVRPGYYTQHEE